ncbi:NAD(P)-binding protein [Micromonospora sp. NPDC005979]|uniref:NAD(P)-binding protein n=1 Tax=Micromonospora sp. NPDC005979 TaxID=3156726 RepID=UPI0033AA9E13
MSDEHRPIRYLVHGDDVLAQAVTRQLLAVPGALVTVVVPPRASDLFASEELPSSTVFVSACLDPETLARCGPVDAVALLRRETAVRDEMLVSATYPRARLVVRRDLDPAASEGVRRFSAAALTAHAYVATVAMVAPRPHRRLTTILRAVRPRYAGRVVRDQLRARVARAAVVALVLAAVNSLVVRVLLEVSVGDAFIYTLMMQLYGVDVDFDASAATQAYQLGLAVLTVLGSVMTGVYLGDALQHGRALAAAGVPPARISGHLVLVGLGERGTHVMRELHAVGEDLVAVDARPTARGVSTARQQGVQVVIGDARWSETLLQAALQRSRAVLVLPPDDDTGLEIMMAARSARPDLPVIWLPADSEIAVLAYRQQHVTVPELTQHDLARAVVASLRDGEQHESQDRPAVSRPQPVDL